MTPIQKGNLKLSSISNQKGQKLHIYYDHSYEIHTAPYRETRCHTRSNELEIENGSFIKSLTFGWCNSNFCMIVNTLIDLNERLMIQKITSSIHLSHIPIITETNIKMRVKLFYSCATTRIKIKREFSKTPFYRSMCVFKQ